MKYVKNNTAKDYVFLGKTINVGEYYAIPDVDLVKWVSDSAVLAAVTSMVLIVAKDDTGTGDYSNMLEGLSFLQNSVPSSVTVSKLPQAEPFSTSIGHSFKGQGVSQLCLAGQMTQIKLVVDATYDLTGIELLNSALGDLVNMKIYDDANGTYSTFANAELNQFGINWFVKPDHFHKMLPYAARVNVGMVICIEYENKDIANDRMIYMNLDLHKVMAV